jgi:hypothetical protein
LAVAKSPNQSTENKPKASTTTSNPQTKQPNKPPLIMIKGFENHEHLTSILKPAIGGEHYQNRLMNIGITKVNISSDYAYRILHSLKIYNIH